MVVTFARYYVWFRLCIHKLYAQVIFSSVKVAGEGHYVNVSVLIKFSQKTSIFTLIISSP